MRGGVHMSKIKHGKNLKRLELSINHVKIHQEGNFLQTPNMLARTSQPPEL